ncbi:MAG TPA: NAD(P)H-dependent oxidoreductase [Ilumatobacter sp.]|nr:NAD(P)H-dependent oxidoreductase [Ilumatobacter sp.]
MIAHPCADSFTHTAAERARVGLEAAGHSVITIDLYAEQFVAAMSQAERVTYHDSDPALDDQVIAHGRLLTAAQIVVFVYPTWWSGLPAMLKGWLDRVLVPGVGFTFNARGKVRPGLPQVRRIVGVSTYGSPRAYVAAVNDNGRRIISRTFRMSCGVRARTTWLGFYAMDTRTDDERRAFLDRVEHKMASF